MTDAPDSPLARACDIALVGPGGMEPALAKTRSYATALQRGYALALTTARALGRPAPGLEATLARAGELAAGLVAGMHCEVRELARRFATVPRIVVVGGGPELATANEAALKVTEAAAMHADAWEVEEATHGTWASTEPGELVVVLAAEGRSAGHARRVASGMHAAGAEVWVLSNGAPMPEATAWTALPDVDELLMPLLSVLPLYAFAYELALARGLNPDIMRTDVPRYARARRIMRPSLADRPAA